MTMQAAFHNFFLSISLRYQSAPSVSGRSNKPSPVAGVWAGAAVHRITNSPGACWAVLALPARLGSYTWYSLLGACHLAPKHSLSSDEPQHCGVSISDILPEQGEQDKPHDTNMKEQLSCDLGN